MRTTAKMGLTSWDQPDDRYSYAQLAGNWQILDFHDHSPGRGVPIAAGGLAPGAVLSSSIAAGVIGYQHLGASLALSAGVNQTAQTVKGVSVNAGTGTRTSTAYGALNDAADSVTVVLPTNGLIEILCEATWQESVSGAANAALFIGANQIQIAGQNVPVVQAAGIGGTAAEWVPLATSGQGLISPTGGTGYTGDVTTGQIVGGVFSGQGGPCYAFGTAGTYAVSLQFKASSGTVSAKNRKLWVRALSYS